MRILREAEPAHHTTMIAGAADVLAGGVLSQQQAAAAMPAHFRVEGGASITRSFRVFVATHNIYKMSNWPPAWHRPQPSRVITALHQLGIIH